MSGSRGGRGDGAAARIEEAEPGGLPSQNGMLAVEMTAHDVSPAQVRRPTCLASCIDDAIPGHGVIARDHALVLMTEDLLEVNGGAEGREGRGGIGGARSNSALKSGRKRSREYRLAAATVVMPAPRSSLTSRPSQGAVHAFTAAAGLGGVAEDMLDAELGQRPPHLGQFRAVDAAAGDGGVGGPVRAIGVEGHRQPPGGEHRRNAVITRACSRPPR